ncbi:MAG: PAS domain-containing protein [Candidatus Levybacteria bacterium]|nr:PAS domain-containing protein [Candidatus Levybacteria bacterium]
MAVSKKVSKNLHSFREITDSIPAMVAIYNIHTGKYVYVNRSIKRLLGYSPEDFIKKGMPFVSSLVHPDDIPKVALENKKALKMANKKGYKKDKDPISHFEYRMMHKDGKYRWLHTDGSVFSRDKNGKVEYVLNASLNITKRKEMEEKYIDLTKNLEEKIKERTQNLEKEEKKFKTLVENSWEAVLLVDAKARLLYATPSIVKLFGRKFDEFMGVSGIKFVHPLDITKVLKKLSTLLLKPNSRVTLESRIKHKLGHYRWVEATATNLLKDPDVKAIVVNLRDITERKTSEENLKTALKDLQDMKYALDQSSIVSITNNKGIIEYVNDRYTQISKYAKKELIGKTHHLLSSNYHPKEFFHNLWKTVLSGKVWHGEIRNKAKDGSFYWEDTTIVPFLDHLGRPKQFIEIKKDITKQKKFYEDLQTSEERLRIAIAAGKIGVWEWDIIENKIIWSERIYEIHGVKKEDFKGTIEEYTKLIYPDDRKTVEEAIKQALLGKETYSLEFRAYGPNQSVIWIHTRATVVFDGKKPIKMLGATFEITQRKELEQRKDDFIALASHELKTPLTSLKIFTQVFEQRFKRQGDIQMTTYFNAMDKQIDKLTSLVNSLLDSSRVRQGKLSYKKNKFRLKDLILEVVQSLQSITKTHKIEVVGDDNNEIVADRDRIGQVLINLINNAIKYSPNANRVTVSFKKMEDNMQTSVQDFGVGISQEEKDRIFERFSQARSSPLKRTFPGLGLGLYISKEIIERHNGKIWLKTKENKGSTFYFTLPIKKNTN